MGQQNTTTTHSLGERLLEHGSDVMALDIGSAETLGPADKLAVVNTVLCTGVGEGEAQREVVCVLVTPKVVTDEAVETLGAKVEQLLAIVLLLLLGETVLCLRDLKLAASVEGDEADTQVGASEVDGEVLALLGAGGPLRVSKKRKPLLTPKTYVGT